MSITVPKREVIYPDSDGEPMAENTRQFRMIVTIQGGLDVQYRDEPDVFVAGALFIYPVEGDPNIRIAPDILVAFGRPKGDRGSYRVWDEGGIFPQVIFEVLSPGNRPGEMGRKFQFYDDHGAEEYYVVDPDRVDWAVWKRERGRLRVIENTAGWASPLLGIRFEIVGDDVRVIGRDGQPFRSYLEVAHQQQLERQRAEQERQRAEQERQRAEQERQLRLGTQADLERLRERLRSAGIDPDKP